MSQKLSMALLLATSIASLAGCGVLSDAADSGERLEPVRELPAELIVGGDHHMHMRSPEFVTAMQSVAADLPDMFRGDAEKMDSAVNAEALISELDEAGIAQGAVLSVGYIPLTPEMVAAFGQDRARELARAENDYTAREVAKFPERLVGACGINPLDADAVQELDRCSALPSMIGAKLHLFSSDVDLRNADHLARLKKFFRSLEQREMPALIHFHGRRADFGSEEVRIAIEELFQPHPDVPVYLLHMAGWGSGGENPAQVLESFVEAFEDGALSKRDNIYFEISASFTRREDNKALAQLIERLGAERIVFGADFDAFLRPSFAAQNFWTHMPLDEQIIADILDNRAPIFTMPKPSLNNPKK